MGEAREALEKLVAAVGEEQAAKLVTGLADLVAGGERPYDELVTFLGVRPKLPSAVAEAMKTIASRPFSEPLPEPAKIKFAGGRPNRLQVYEELYREAADKEAVLRLAERDLGRTSFYQLRKKLGLDK